MAELIAALYGNAREGTREKHSEFPNATLITIHGDVCIHNYRAKTRACRVFSTLIRSLIIEIIYCIWGTRGAQSRSAGSRTSLSTQVGTYGRGARPPIRILTSRAELSRTKAATDSERANASLALLPTRRPRPLHLLLIMMHIYY